MVAFKALSVGCLILASCWSSVFAFPWEARDDDASCDPCDESCDPDNMAASKRDLASVPRLVLWNDTSPWGENEASRWRIRLDERGNLLANVLEFDCSQMADVCSNMCYGVYCKGQSWTLTISRDNPKLCTKARQANNCGNKSPNYCSPKAGFSAGYSCDEYPFASTTQGQASTKTATRCVEKVQNSRQGGRISSYYQNGNQKGRFPDGTSYEVAMDNYAGIRHCEAYKTKKPAVCTIGTGTSEVSQK